MVTKKVPQTRTLRDTIGDVVGQGRRRHGRTDLDIRLVTLTRTTTALRIVVETVAPMRSGSYVRFRYHDPEWGEDIWFDAEVGRRGEVLVDRNDAYGPGYSTWATVGGSGRRFVLTLKFEPRGELPRYRRFGWLVGVSDNPTTVPTPYRDHIPNQVDVLIAPRLARFP